MAPRHPLTWVDPPNFDRLEEVDLETKQLIHQLHDEFLFSAEDLARQFKMPWAWVRQILESPAKPN
jgi:hypothetical protein